MKFWGFFSFIIRKSKPKGLDGKSKPKGLDSNLPHFFVQSERRGRRFKNS